MIAALHRFWGGVKPESHKAESAGQGIRLAPLPRRLVVPMRQSTSAALPMVEAGDKVLKGQRIGATESAFAAAVHAPTSGMVLAVEALPLAHPSGLPGLCVVIEPDGEERWAPREAVNHRAAAPDELRDILRDAGIVGLGGAAFPSHVKMRKPAGGPVSTLIINGAECEPWITCDDALMRVRAAGIVAGAALIRRVLGADRVLVGIEDNKPEAIAAMAAAAADSAEPMDVLAVPTLYPAGGEKQLIRVLTGIEIPYGKLGPDFGVQCFNVGTAYAVHRALNHGEPLISRVVTVAGSVARAQNVEVLIGTPIDDLLRLAEPLPDTDHYLMGGPMMGFTLPSTAAPVVKATNCVLAVSPRLFPPPPPEMPCIRCGRCALACPAQLQPLELYWFARARNFGKCQEYALFDCIECGCCSYVCPSSIRLVDYYRFAKAEIRSREHEKAGADAAKDRFEQRNARIEREKEEKAARLAAKTSAARQSMEKRQSAPAPGTQAEARGETAAATGKDSRSLIEAAMARAQAQKAQVQPRNTVDLTAEQRAEIAEIERRRASIRKMARTPEAPPE